jgi:RNA polymerase sigma-70 factor, ECF subfamily
MKNGQDKIEELFHRYYSPLCNYASKIVHNNHDAEDIVQHLFIQLFQKNNLHSIQNIENYLLRCVKFKCIDFLRTRQYSVPIDLLPEEAGNEHPEVTEEDIEPLFHYYAAKLPPKTREVFLMSRVGQMTYKEIAAELNVSQKTVENQMGNALKKLKSILNEEHCFLMMV